MDKKSKKYRILLLKAEILLLKKGIEIDVNPSAETVVSTLYSLGLGKMYTSEIINLGDGRLEDEHTYYPPCEKSALLYAKIKANQKNA